MGQTVKTLLATILALTTVTLSDGKAFAASATIYLSPNAGTIYKGDNLAVELRENSGDKEVNIVRAYISYPIDKLSVEDIVISPTFNVVIKSSAKDGSIEIFAGKSNQPVSGDKLVATITIRAISDSGTANLRIDKDNSYVVGPGDPGIEPLAATRGGEYTLSPPPSASAPTPVAPTTKPPVTPAPSKANPSEAPSPVASANKRVSIAVTTPNTQRTKEPLYIGFWVPILTLVATLAVSTLVAKGYTIQSIRRHFLFLGPHKVKKYTHI